MIDSSKPRVNLQIGDKNFKIVPLKVFRLDELAELIADKFSELQFVKQFIDGGETQIKDMVEKVFGLGKAFIFRVFNIICTPTDDDFKPTVEWLAEHLDIIDVEKIAKAFKEVNIDTIPFLIGNIAGKVQVAMTEIQENGKSASSGTTS